MSLASYILRRVLLLVPTLFGVSLLTFALSRIVPGDPARLAAGAQATPEMYEQIRQEFGLDRSAACSVLELPERAASGRLGPLDPLPAAGAGRLARLLAGHLRARPLLRCSSRSLIGVPLGILAAVRADRPADQVSRVVALLGVSLPAFWLAILFQIFFGLRLGWLPVSGRLASLADAPPTLTGLYTVDSLVSGQWATLGDSAAAAPAAGDHPELSRHGDHHALHPRDAARNPGPGLRAHRAGEGSRRNAGWSTRHALRNALIPTITMIGLSFGWAMGGSVLVETVFDWPGMGLYATKSALTLDFMPIMGIALLYGLVFSVINILVDVTYGALDPRVSRA